MLTGIIVAIGGMVLSFYGATKFNVNLVLLGYVIAIVGVTIFLVRIIGSLP